MPRPPDRPPAARRQTVSSTRTWQLRLRHWVVVSQRRPPAQAHAINLLQRRAFPAPCCRPAAARRPDVLPIRWCWRHVPCGSPDSRAISRSSSVSHRIATAPRRRQRPPATTAAPRSTHGVCLSSGCFDTGSNAGTRQCVDAVRALAASDSLPSASAHAALSDVLARRQPDQQLAYDATRTTSPAVSPRRAMSLAFIVSVGSGFVAILRLRYAASCPAHAVPHWSHQPASRQRKRITRIDWFGYAPWYGVTRNLARPLG